MTGTQDPAVEAATPVELLRARARQDPDRSAYTFLVDGEREGDHLTFGELDRRARAVGTLLQERVAAGERVLLLYPSGLDFVAGFFGCMYGGAVAVPAPVGEGGQLERTVPRLQAVARDADPTLVLTTSENRDRLEELFRLAPELADLPVLATDALEPGLEDRWKDPEARPDDLCFLQYTSGSTAAPKGVMVSHANLLYTAKDIDAGWKYDAESVVVTWLPIFHDMGLIVGIVLPAYKGFHCYVMTPVAFIQKPSRWLAAMSRYEGTHSAGPNFAYDLCARKIPPEERAGLDLSSWVVTLSSAEPVRRETMERFVEAFGPCGFRMETFCPGFGLAESTVKTTASNVGVPPTFLNVRRSDLELHRLVPVDPEARGPGVVSLVGNGAPILDTRVVIADPERRARLGPNQIGEIWVAGPCVAQGYWKKPEDTESTFRAMLSDGDGPFMRTGDLGFVDEHGELFCTGRIKDLIIVRGRNLYPQDVELAAEQRHGALRPGCSAAFSADLEGEERLVIAFEVDPKKNPDPEQVFGAVRQGIAEDYELAPYALVALEPRTVPKTSSGKIQRRAARELFMTLGLAPLAVSVQRETEAVPKSAGAFVRKRILGAGEAQRQRMVEFYLLSMLAPTLPGVDPNQLDLEEPLVHQGLDLPTALDWVDTIEKTLGVTLPLARFFSRVTMKELATTILGELARTEEEAPEAPAREEEKAPKRPPTAREIEDWMIARIAAQTGMDEGAIEVHRPFSYIGLDSVLAVDLAMDLEDWLARPLPSTLVWDYPTIEAAARFLGAEPEPAPEARPVSARAEPPTHEPIAIVGMACRFPGADDVEGFWRMLIDKVDAISEAPPERWSNEELYDPKPGRPGKLATKWGGFLKDIDLFDAAHFDISAREASRLDPQQRILLETVWEALEDGGQSPDRLRGSRSALFLGTSSREYQDFQLRDLRNIDGYASTGNASSVSAGRVNYVLDWNGPSMAIDTACSSSLVALHQARRALLNGECDLALAAGTHLTITPEWSISFSHAQMMAPDGRCKTFDAAANGYVRGEGCGAIVMKRLSDAIRDRDDVVCTIRGSAVNHDGASNGITAPSGHAQELVIQAALRDGGVAGRELGYVEAHGTGTPLGDPIECAALANVVSEGRTKPLVIGSVKTNIGHLEPSAGIAGVIKAALALQRETIPPQIHFHEVNPRIPLDELPLEIADEAIPWPRGREPRFAGVSSFGFAGTNSHVVLEEAPVVGVKEAEVERPLHVLCLSGRTEEHVPEVARRLSKHLAEHPDLPVADVCFTENTGRAHLAHRVAFPVASRADLCAKLAQLAEGAEVEGARRGEVGDRKPGTLAFVFPSAEGIDPRTGRELYATQPAFRRSMDRCREAVAELGGDPEAPGPAAFALSWSLGELLRSSGLAPDTATGAGVGRNVAEVFRGERTLEEGLKLAIECGTTPAGPGAPEGGGDDEVRVAIGSRPTWEWGSLVDCLADLHVRGVGVDWEGFEDEYPRRRLHLPTYPFERKPYWFKPRK